MIENIMPGTEYEYYAVSGTDAQGDVKTFTTSPIVNLKIIHLMNGLKMVRLGFLM